MKNAINRKKPKKQHIELKNTLCDIIDTLNKFSKTDRKLEELANFCTGGTRVKSETNR